MLEMISEVFEDVFGCSPSDVSESTTPDDIAKWDSMGHMALTSRLEVKFDVSIDVVESMEMTTVSNIMLVLRRKGA